MPKLGEIIGPIKRGDPNIASLSSWGHIYQWQSCPDCHKERWVLLAWNRNPNPRCKNCNWIHIGKARGPAKKGSWKGGKPLSSQGYIRVKVYPEDFFAPMRDNRGYVFEHRLVMAKHLGRNLHRWELVHHKGVKYPIGSIENRQDNRIENLQIIVTGYQGNGRHTAKIVCPYCNKEFKVC